jgi:hypothetical protein
MRPGSATVEGSTMLASIQTDKRRTDVLFLRPVLRADVRLTFAHLPAHLVISLITYLDCHLHQNRVQTKRDVSGTGAGQFLTKCLKSRCGLESTARE